MIAGALTLAVASAYPISDLPTPIPCHKDGMTLSVACVERATIDLSSLDYLQKLSSASAGPVLFDQEHLVDLPAVFRTTTAANCCVMGIAAWTHYFEK